MEQSEQIEPEISREDVRKVTIPQVKLSNGHMIPVLGIGTSRTAHLSLELSNALNFAFKIGYRHVDSAFIYFNEGVISKAVEDAIESNVLKREELFITSKLWNTHHNRELVKLSLDLTLKNMGLDYIDMYMIHTPMAFKENSGSCPWPVDENGQLLYSDANFVETYQAIEECVEAGQVKTIGVSNFNITQLEELLKVCKIKPAVIQIECNPYFQNRKLVEFCQNNDIRVCAYGSLGAPDLTETREDVPKLLEDKVIAKIAKTHNKTPAQICLKWALQKDMLVIPRCLTQKHILENAQLFDFELTDKCMDALNKLERNARIFTAGGQRNHPYYPFTPEE